MSGLFALVLAAAASAAPNAWTVSGASTAVLGSNAVLVYRPAAPIAGKLAPDVLACGTTDFAVVKAAARPDGSWAWTVLPMNMGALDFTARWTLDGRALTAPTVRLNVTAPKVAKDADIADIKAPRSAPLPWWPWLVAAALAAAAYAAWRARKNRAIDAPAVAVAPPVPPEAAAENALAELEASGLWERGEHAAFYLRLTDILRVYLEARYGEAATAMTSAEVARLVKAREPDLRASATAREVLSRADLVKFARIKPSATEGPDDVGLVRALIHATTPTDAARVPAAATAAEAAQ
ncbi:MAG: hypothetical protein HKL90_16575 [Elusimicrobia bacterium]|nr:hypothetical protein [Elusimicrobiota bacterium]